MNKYLLFSMLFLTNCFSVTTASQSELSNSKIYISNNYLLANNESTTRIYVQVQSKQYTAVVDAEVEVKANDCEYDKPGITNKDGIAEVTIQCKAKGDKELFVYVKSSQFSFLLEERPIVHVVEKLEPSIVKAGIATPLQIFLHDKRKIFEPNYSGQIVFRSSDPLATLPGMVNVSAEKLGYIVIENSLIWRTPGAQKLWIEDVLTGNILNEKNFQIEYGDITSFQLSVRNPTAIQVEQPFELTIRARDAAGNTVEDYQEIIRFFTDDRQAVIPFDARFQASNKGILVVPNIVLRSSGERYILARNNKGDIVGQIKFSSVHPGDVTEISLTHQSPPSALKPWFIDVGLEDAFGNPVITSPGLITLSTSDPNATIFPAFVFSPNSSSTVQSVPVTFFKAGIHWITAELQVNQQIIATYSFAIQVLPGNLTHFKNNTVIQSVLAGTPQIISIEPYDDAENKIEIYQGSISFSTTDPNAFIPSSRFYTGQSQDIWGFSVTFQQAGTQQLIVRDETSGIAIVIEMQVYPNNVYGLAFRDTPVQVTAGVSNTYSVVAVDIYGNQIADFQGEVLIECSDQSCQGDGNKLFSLQQDGLTAVVSPFLFQQSGAKQLHAQFIGLPLLQPATQNILTLPAAPAQLAFVIQPTDVKSCTTAEIIQVAILDPYGNPVAIDGVAIRLDLYSKSGVKEIYLQGNTQQYTVQGIATFSTINFKHSNEQIRLIAKSNGLQPAISDSFEVLRMNPVVSIDGFRPHEKGLAIDYTVVSYCPVELNFSFDNSIYKAHMSADSVMPLPRHPIVSGVYHETFVWDVKKDLPDTNRISFFSIRATVDGRSHQAIYEIPVNTMPQYDWELVPTHTTNCLEMVDLNQDGIQDMIGCEGDHVYVYYQDKNGDLQYQFLFAAAGVQEINNIKAIDMNRDQILDLLIIDRSGALLHPFYAIGPNHYMQLPSIQISPDMIDFVFADVNIDGKEDFLWISDSNNTILHTMLAAEVSLFQPATSIPLSGSVHQIDVGHFNNDDLPDLVLLRDNEIHILVAEQLSYSTPIVLTFPQYVHRFVVGMLDRNKYTDIVAISQQEMYFYTNSSASPVQLPSSTHPIDAEVISVFLADMNQDKKTDIVLIQDGTNSSVKVRLQSPSRTFSPIDSYTLSLGSVRHLAFFSDIKSKKTDVLLQRHDRTLARGSYSLFPSSKELNLDKVYVSETSSPFYIVPADIDEDGFTDIVYATSNEIVFQKGTGQINTPLLPMSYRYYIDAISSFLVEDINGDNHLDLVVASASSSYLVLLLGDGQGSFTINQTDRLGDFIQDVKVADMNQDGHLDLLALDTFLGQVHLFLNDGSGVFQTPTLFIQVEPGTTAIDVNDYNGDSFIDIAFVNPLYSHVMIAQQGISFSFDIVKSQDAVFRDIISSDLDKDSYMDLVLVDPRGGVFISYGDGSGLFQGYRSMGTWVYKPTLVDLDDNQTLDIVKNVVLFNSGGSRQFSGLMPWYDHTFVGRNTAAADFNNDAIVDLITPNDGMFYIKHRRSRDELSLLGQETNRRLINNQSIVNCIPPFSPRMKEKLIDLDRNGFDDIVCNVNPYLQYDNSFNLPVNPNDYRATIYMNFRDSTSSIRETRLTSNTLTRQDGFAIDDINRDGTNDFIMYDTLSSTISLWLSTGILNWQEQPAIAIPSFSVLELEDINHDKKADMIIGTTNGIQVAFGLGTGGFTSWTSIASGLSAVVRDMQLADFNNDRNLDILFLAGSQLSILFMDPLGAPSVVYPMIEITGSSSMLFDKLDMNSDGFLDVVFSQSNQTNLHIAINNTLGGFQSPVSLIANDYLIRSIGILDSDGDGIQDIVTIMELANERYLLPQVLIITEDNIQKPFTRNHKRQPFNRDPRNYFFSVSDLSDNGIDELIINNSWYVNAYPLGIRY